MADQAGSVEQKKCSDCGTAIGPESKRTECRHCEKCVDFRCMSTHGRKQAGEGQ